MFLKHVTKAFAFFNILFLAGCSTGNIFPAAGDHPFKIESDPSAAAVYVMGEKIGVTPIMITPKDVFPNTYPREKVSVYGRITLKKEGCADFTRTVSAEISNAGLSAKLDCGDLYSASSKTSGDAPRSSETVEQRLDKIKGLLSKGLINEEEAKKARERILNDL
ncbi:MAG: hypothetical protein ABI536_04565 [Gallionella sp.]